MKQIFIIWSYWILFLIVCGGVVYIVQRSAKLNDSNRDAAPKTQKDMKLNEDLLKIEGKEWIASEKESEWTPPLDNEKVSVPGDPGQTDPKVEDPPAVSDSKPGEPAVKSQEQSQTQTEKDLKILEEVKKVNEEKPIEIKKDGPPE